MVRSLTQLTEVEAIAEIAERISASHELDQILQTVVGAVLPIRALYTLVYVWRRNLPLVILIHFMTDLPLVLIAAGVLRLP